MLGQVATAQVPAPIAPEEQELIASLRAGDERAFLAMVQQHHGGMLRVAQLFVSSRAVAEEVVQETWLAVLEGIGDFEGRAPLRAWIFRIVANRARTRATREARSSPFSALAADDAGPSVNPSRFLPQNHPRYAGNWAAPPERWADERLLTRETVELARRAIEALPPAQRQVIVLRDVEGCSSEDVCEALSLSEGNQRVLLHRARSRVRAALEEHMKETTP